MRFWLKVFQENRLLRDTVVEVPGELSRTAKVFQALEEGCRELDLPVPIWLKNNVRDFQRIARARFRQDSFIETVGFDYLEFQVIEEDKNSENFF